MSQLSRFLNSIQKKYIEAKKVYVKERVANYVIRGRGKNIASESEDLFAKLLWRVFSLKTIYIFVDQPISLVGNSKTYYPDIAICHKIDKNNYEIIYMIDLKMDVGWLRNSFSKHAKELNKICNEMKKSNNLKGKLRDVAGEKTSYMFSIKQCASYDMVIISSRNSGKPKNEEKMKSMSHNKDMNLWVLSSGEHPNHITKLKYIKLHENDWKMLTEKIKKAIVE